MAHPMYKSLGNGACKLPFRAMWCVGLGRQESGKREVGFRLELKLAGLPTEVGVKKEEF
jgi:hypothetical protein